MTGKLSSIEESIVKSFKK